MNLNLFWFFSFVFFGTLLQRNDFMKMPVNEMQLFQRCEVSVINP